MFRVAYRSTLKAGVGEAEILSIAERSAEKNREAGLTGAWLLSGRTCLGALEGDPRVLRHLIETIWDDPRHDEFEVLEMRTSDSALFDWPFRLVRAGTFVAEPDLKAHPGLIWLAGFAGGLDAVMPSAGSQKQRQRAGH